MLIDYIVDYCNDEFSKQDSKRVCKECKHFGECSGSCKQCLEEVHYPNRYVNGMKDYICPNMINFYVCDYSYKYASEIWYLLKEASKVKKMSEYHIMSIGCGACPDLMAFESFCKENKINKKVTYYGLDVNELWKPVHKKINTYCKKQGKLEVTFRYADAIEFFNKYYVDGINIVFLQYVISHFYNTKQIDKIDKFFDDLVDSIVSHKLKGSPFIIMINDVNSCNRGRDYFEDIITKLRENNYHGVCPKYYFSYNIQNSAQRYGNKHESNKVLYNVPEGLSKYEPWRECSSAQLLIEVE